MSRVNAGDHNHVLALNDTDVAWTALREPTSADSRQTSVQQERKAKTTGRFKRLVNAVRFTRRTGSSDNSRTTQAEVLAYDQDLRVSIKTSFI